MTKQENIWNGPVEDDEDDDGVVVYDTSDNDPNDLSEFCDEHGGYYDELLGEWS